jgi:hypothetical protein
MDVFNDPQDYEKQIKNLDENYMLVLNELSKSYPPAKAFPNDKKLSNTFDKDTANLNTIQSKFFILNDKLKQDIQKISISIEKQNKIIKMLDKENDEIKKKADMLQDSKRGSKQMANDTQYLYQVRFVENSVLLVGIFTIAYKLFYSFKK